MFLIKNVLSKVCGISSIWKTSSLWICPKQEIWAEQTKLHSVVNKIYKTNWPFKPSSWLFQNLMKPCLHHQTYLQSNPRRVIAPPINRWQCSVCDGEGKRGGSGCCNHGSNLGRRLLGRKWAAEVRKAVLCLLPTELKINIILHLYCRRLADAFILCDKCSRISFSCLFTN